MALAISPTVSRLGPPAPKRSRDVAPTTMPGGASSPSTSGVDAGIPRIAGVEGDLAGATSEGAAPAARSVLRQSRPPSVRSGLSFAPRACTGLGAPASALVLAARPPPARIRIASSTVSSSSMNSRTPSSRRCSRYRRSRSLASSNEQSLHSVENRVRDVGLRPQWQWLVTSVASDQRHAVRVDGAAGTGLTRLIHNDQIKGFRRELLATVIQCVISLQRKPDDNGTGLSHAGGLHEHVGGRHECQRARSTLLLDFRPCRLRSAKIRRRGGHHEHVGGGELSFNDPRHLLRRFDVVHAYAGWSLHRKRSGNEHDVGAATPG